VIHPLAVVSEHAQIGQNVQIGPFCFVGPEAILEDGVQLFSHVVIAGQVHLGESVQVFPFASLGCPPQHLAHRGQNTRVTIGKKTIIRENVTVHRAIDTLQRVTSIGSECFIMADCHIAHDCQIGDQVIMANGATLGGHVSIGSHTNIGGMTAIQQFTRVGSYSMVGGASGLTSDLIPFGMARGNPACLEGLNIRGLKRHGFQREQIFILREMLKYLFSETENTTFDHRFSQIPQEFLNSPMCETVHTFLSSREERPFCMPSGQEAAEFDLWEPFLDAATA
jgi:UDP-N-acetylglucosamine acyltransferase